MNQTAANKPLRAIIALILLLWGVSVVYPLLWTLLNALKNNEQFLLHKPWSLPEAPLLWSNFSYVWDRYNFGTYFFNSLAVTVGSTMLGLLLSSTTAYVLARFVFKGQNALYLYYIASMMIPLNLTLIPLFFLLNDLHLINSKLGLIVVYSANVLSFGIFILTGFYRALPKELDEAATIDGCSDYGTFFRIMLPLSQPGLMTVAIMNVLTIWNEYIIGTILTNDPAKYTLPVGIAVIQTEMQYRTEWGPLFAALTITIIPILIVYIFFQRQIAVGITVGAVK